MPQHVRVTTSGQSGRCTLGAGWMMCGNFDLTPGEADVNALQPPGEQRGLRADVAHAELMGRRLGHADHQPADLLAVRFVQFSFMINLLWVLTPRITGVLIHDVGSCDRDDGCYVYLALRTLRVISRRILRRHVADDCGCRHFSVAIFMVDAHTADYTLNPGTGTGEVQERLGLSPSEIEYRPANLVSQPLILQHETQPGTVHAADGAPAGQCSPFRLAAVGVHGRGRVICSSTQP
jgi:hypothetical protein